jgi:hypothetical protein
MVTMTAALRQLPATTTHEGAPNDLACGKYVFCAGMPRSGSTWQYQVASHLLEQHRGGVRGGFLEQAGDFERIEEQTAGRAPWLTLKTHNGYPPYAAALREGRALALYSYRDVRDVTFSLMHKMHRSFDAIVHETFMLEQCLNDHAFWTALPNVLCQRYEDVMADPVGGVKEMAAFLGCPITEVEAERLAAAYSLEANRARAEQLMETLRAKGVDLNHPDNAVLHDEHSQLHWNHIRQGRIGGWREEVTPEQLSVLATMCGVWLLENGYERDAGWILPGVKYLASELHTTKRELLLERAAHTRLDREVFELLSLGPLALSVARQVHRAIGCFPRLGKSLKILLRCVGVRCFHPEPLPPPSTPS